MATAKYAADVGDDARSAFKSLEPKRRPRSRPAFGVEAKCPMDGVRDEIALEYSSMADDASQGTKRREAAMLLSAAEESLNEEDVAACINSAEEALSLFREMGEINAVADTLIIMIRAHKLKTDVSNVDPSEALRIANVELDIAKMQKNTRGEACMLLALAEIKSGMRGRTQLGSALDAATESLELFKSVGDKKMEATVQLALVNIHFMKDKYQLVADAAKEALRLFKEVGDEKGQAKAMHGMALSYVVRGDYESMQMYAKDALGIYRKIGARRSEAFELSVIAQFHLLNEKPQKALPAAHEGLAIVRELEHAGKAPEAFCLLLVIEALGGINRKMPALKLAEKGLERFQETGDKRGITFGLEVVLFAHFEMEAFGEAMRISEEALEVIQECGDKRLELNLLFLQSVVQIRMENNSSALQTMKEALGLAQELEDQEEEANVQQLICDIHLIENAGGEALKAANEAKALFDSVGDRCGEASAMVLAGFAHSVVGDNDKAIVIATEAQELYEEEDNIEGACIALRLIVECHLLQEQYDEALQAAMRRLELWEDIGNKKEIAFAMHLVASVHIAGGSPEEARRVASDARKLAQEVGNKRLEASVLLEVTAAEVMFMEKMGIAENMPAVQLPKEFTDALATAMRSATEAVTISGKYCTKKDDANLRARALYWRANLLSYSGRDPESLRVAAQAERLYRETAVGELGAGECLIVQAYTQHRMGDREKGLALANEALEIGRGFGSKQLEDAALAAIDKIEYKPEPVFVQQAVTQQQLMPAGGAAEQAPVVSVAAVAQPKGLDPVMTKTKLMKLVKDVISSDDDIETDSPFMEAGMDSLSSVQLMTEVSKEFQLSLSPSLIFDFPTVRAMVDHLVEESKAAVMAY